MLAILLYYLVHNHFSPQTLELRRPIHAQNVQSPKKTIKKVTITQNVYQKGEKT